MHMEEIIQMIFLTKVEIIMNLYWGTIFGEHLNDEGCDLANSEAYGKDALN